MQQKIKRRPKGAIINTTSKTTEPILWPPPLTMNLDELNWMEDMKEFYKGVEKSVGSKEEMFVSLAKYFKTNKTFPFSHKYNSNSNYDFT